MSDLADRRLYLCTPIRPDLESFLVDCIKGGVDIVQLREKEASAREIISAGRRARAVCRDLGVPFVINDRPDLAIEIGADGVHVGQDDTPVELCRHLLGDDAVIGLSTHANSELDEALDEPVSYLSAGPVVATPTKPGRPGTGAGYAAAASKRAQVPVFVTGGVDVGSIPSLVALGVQHFVVVRALTEASRPFEAASSLRHAINEALNAQR